MNQPVAIWLSGKTTSWHRTAPCARGGLKHLMSDGRSVVAEFIPTVIGDRLSAERLKQELKRRRRIENRRAR